MYKDKLTYEEISKSLKFTTRALINGQLVESSSKRTFDSVNPSNGKKITEITSCNELDVDQAVKAARIAFDSGKWSNIKPDERKKILFKFANLIEENAIDLAVMESIDSGKPISDTITGDIPETVECFRFAAEAIDKLNDEITPTGPDDINLVRRVPIGVCAAIVPWNFPILMAAWKLAPILASGNTVVIKPAKLTSLTLLKLGELSIEAGFPPGVLNIIPGSGVVVGDALANHMDVDLITFTGSTQVGRSLLRKSGESNLKRVLLELGGKNPSVVMPDIQDLDFAAEQIVSAGLWNMGQNCTQNSRILVHKSIKDKILPKIIDEAKKWTVGNSLNPNNKLGPVIESRHMNKILEYIDKGVKEGGKIVLGGQRILNETGGFFIEPTIFDEVDQSMTIAKEEIFGPAFSILTFDTMEEGIQMANDTEYGLQASIWTDNINNVATLAKGINAGVISVNHFSEGDITTPFGGFKMSGFMSRDKSIWANKQYTEIKSVFIKTR